MSTIACAICGVVQSPETIEGCWANARKAGVEALFIKRSVPFPPGANGDYAHVWVEQPPRACTCCDGDPTVCACANLTAWPCGHAVKKAWAGPCPICAELVQIGSRAEKAEAEMAAYRTREKDDFYNAPAQRDEWKRRAEAAQDAIDRLGDFLGLASHDLESAYRSMRSDLIRCFVKAKAAR